MAVTSSSRMHIAVYPWFAFGHLIPYLQISNKLAKKGHRISFFIPSKTLPKLQPFNLFPHLITFLPITVPHVDGLPLGAETTTDVPHSSQFSLIMTAMDHTRPEIEHILQDMRPHAIFFDFVFWMPKLARRLGIKSIYYSVISATTFGYIYVPSRQLCGDYLSEADFMQPPPGYPSSTIKLHAHEARFCASMSRTRFGSDVFFFRRHFTGLQECDAIAFKSSREIEGPYVDYLISEFKKPVLLSGSEDTQQPTTTLEERWAKWLSGFNTGSVIYCALGSECTLPKDQFQELLLGLELSNMPFLSALKLPHGVETVEAALPEGFEQRVGGRGVVYGGWVQQQLILEHPSIGCFITHCGSGSLSEALVRKCQLVMLPHISDHFFRARTLSSVLKVGVEVERGEEDGYFTRESVCKAVKIVMDEEDETGKEIRENRAKIRELLLDKDLEESYINNFIQSLQAVIA
ncbi:UDP-glycosyltransferase 79B30-like [Momordica charantia]|uniref:Glycosyltransferase n=1 Tax=Momordica charantia TaxID=3673 RepID=A0A6J1C317_MOMCH|nr:UDP-glycosyltransferase 79B30-like [Momordica charantia]XP_022135999.1 UDP-glycosyltransferase 79B30-like [Momordica charantia]